MLSTTLSEDVSGTPKNGEEIEAYCNLIVTVNSGQPGVLISIRARLALRFSRASKAAIERSGLAV